MRDYTEPVAEYDGALGPGATVASWETGAGGMSPERWVDCEGFDKLRISAAGDDGDSFSVNVLFSNEAAPVPGVLPDRYYGPQYPSGAVFIVSDAHVVHQDVPLCGAKTVGIELVNGPNVQAQIQLRAFLLR